MALGFHFLLLRGATIFYTDWHRCSENLHSSRHKFCVEVRENRGELNFCNGSVHWGHDATLSPEPYKHLAKTSKHFHHCNRTGAQRETAGAEHINKKPAAGWFGGARCCRRGLTRMSTGLIFNVLCCLCTCLNASQPQTGMANCVQVVDTLVQGQRISIYKHVCSRGPEDD